MTDYVLLTPRETEVLALIAQGMQYSEVADTLGISPHTVRDYASTIRLKLGAANTVNAVFIAVTLTDTLPLPAATTKYTTYVG